MPGWDLAGEVAAVGEGVSGYAPGDRVVGMIPFVRIGGRVGAYAEAAAVDPGWLAPLDPAVSFEEGATLPLNALTAREALGMLALPAGARLLITGRQRRRRRLRHPAGRGRRPARDRAWPAATTRTGSPGSAPPRCSRATPTSAAIDPVDGVLDAVPLGPAASTGALRDGGTAVFTRPPDPPEPERGLRLESFLVSPDAAALRELAAQLAAGELRTRVARVLPLEEAAEGHRLAEAGGLHGKVVLHDAMTRFVMVHGAFAGGWVWGPLADALEAQGHTVEAPDLPGGGRRPHAGRARSPSTPTRSGSARCSRRAPSRPCSSATAWAAWRSPRPPPRCADRIASMVYVAAFLPQDGESLIGLTELPEGEGDQVQANLVVTGDPPVATMPAEASRARDLRALLRRDGGLGDRAAARRSRSFPFTEPVALDGFDFAGIPRAYVLCTQDRAIPPPLQRRMLARGRLLAGRSSSTPTTSRSCRGPPSSPRPCTGSRRRVRAMPPAMPHVAGVEHREVDVRGLRMHVAVAGPASGPPGRPRSTAGRSTGTSGAT